MCAFLYVYDINQCFVYMHILWTDLYLKNCIISLSLSQGVLRQIPLVGSVLNWFSPFQSTVKGRTFNLAAGTQLCVCLLPGCSCTSAF